MVRDVVRRGWPILALGVLAGCGEPTQSTARDVSRGQALYAQHCASCHGADLSGQPDWRERKRDGRLPAPPHDATGHTWHHPMEMLFDMTKHGLVPPMAPEGYQSDMPGFKEVLSDDEIHDVLAYIESTWPDEVRAAREQRFGAPGR